MRMSCTMMHLQTIMIVVLPMVILAEINSGSAGVDLIERKAQLAYQMLGQLDASKAEQLRKRLSLLVSSPSNLALNTRLPLLARESEREGR
ncbi:MAG: hypothetical protein AAES65_10875 [Candidatus Thiodiazotropha sp. (ex. Lucinoma kazani)]